MTSTTAYTEFQPVGRVEDVPPGAVTEVEVNGRLVALCNYEGQYFALDNLCPHKGGPLGKGKLIGDSLMCPWHTLKFRLRTGVCTINPARIATRYKVRVVDGEIQVALQPVDRS